MGIENLQYNVELQRMQTAEIETQTALFKNRPSIIQGVKVYAGNANGNYATHFDDGSIHTLGDTPDKALLKWDAWFLGKEPRHDK